VTAAVWAAALAGGLAIALLVWQHVRIVRLTARLFGVQRRLSALSDLTPPLTDAARESTAQTCQRIAERFAALVPASTVLCFVVEDGHMVLGARSGDVSGSFLREGTAYEGDGMLGWVQRNHCAAIVGPTPARLPPDVPVIDLGQSAGARSHGPLEGSRDRVWALCIPLLQNRGYGLRPAVIGAVYAERGHSAPFAPEELRTAATIAALAGDALQRARFADEVKRQAEIDPLTQLLSAATFRKRLREAVENRRRDVALFFIDTDRFKLWNDTFGHAVGDALLKRLAGVLEEIAVTSGFAGRNGGDEFCIALFDRTKDDAVAVAEELRQRIERTEFTAGPAGVPQPLIPVTISVGVAHFPVDVPANADNPADRLLETADARMYEAKRDGRNRVAYSRARLLRS